jgi:hypothetical protein
MLRSSPPSLSDYMTVALPKPYINPYKLGNAQGAHQRLPSSYRLAIRGERPTRY